MALKQFILAASGSILLGACEPAVDSIPPAPPVEATGQAALDQVDAAKPDVVPVPVTDAKGPKVHTATVDWEKARADFAAQSGTDELLVSIASAGEAPPPVPVLLPTGGPVSIATTGEGGPRFKQTADGYYAVYPYENYDVIVNGTNEVIGERADGARDETMKFTATAAGAQVALSKYGADYLVEFECYEIDPNTGTCIEEAEAMGVAESLVIRGTR